MGFIFPIIMYGAETWTLTKKHIARLDAWWMKQMRIMSFKSKHDHGSHLYCCVRSDFDVIRELVSSASQRHQGRPERSNINAIRE